MATMNIHELKTWPKYFQDIIDGLKDFEIRYNDRDFQVGEKAILHEYDPETNTYTGRELAIRIKYIVKWNDSDIMIRSLRPGYCIIGFK